MINDKKDISKRYFNSKAYTHHDVTTFTIGEMVELFHDGGTHDIETSPLIVHLFRRRRSRGVASVDFVSKPVSN